MAESSLLASAAKYNEIIVNGLDLISFLLITPELLRRIDFDSLLFGIWMISLIPIRLVAAVAGTQFGVLPIIGDADTTVLVVTIHIPP